MPNLALSPGAPNPAPKQEHGGEKENAPSSPPARSSGGGINKKIAGELAAAGRSSAGFVGRSPLEDLSAPSGVAPAGGAIVCKRDSSCKCPECDMAASVFGINDLRQVGGGGRVPYSPDAAAAISRPPASNGGLACSPLPGSGVEGAAPAPPLVSEDAGVAGESQDVAADQEVGLAIPAEDSQTVDAQEEEAAAAVAPPLPVASPSTAAAANPSSAVDGEMPSPEEEAAITGEMSAAGGEDTAVFDEPKVEAEPEAADGGTPAPEHGSTPAESPQQPSLEEAATGAVAEEPSAGDKIAAVNTATGDNGGGNETGEGAGDYDLLSDDGRGNVGEDEDEHGPAEQEEGDALAAAVNGGTCKPPLSGDGSKGGVGLAVEDAATAVAAVGLEGVLGDGGASKKRSSGGRRLSKDVFFECSSEVEHVLASDSESDFDDNDGQPNKHRIPHAAETSIAGDGISNSVPLQAPFNPSAVASASAAATAGGTRSRRTTASSPISLLPVGKANSLVAALETAVAAAAAGGAEAGAEGVAGGTATAEGIIAEAVTASTEPSVGAAPAAEAEPSNENGPTSLDNGQTQGGGARGFLGLGRRRNRRQGAQLELGMADAYGHEDHRAKFSQAEVDAKIKERLSEEKAAFEKTVSAMKAEHEAELQAAAEKLEQSSSDGKRAKIAARDAEALEREIAMLSERYGEAAAAAKTSGKALREKEALLDACTAQLMGLKTDLATARAEHAAEKQAMKEAADAVRRERSAAEGSLQQLELAYNKLEDSEREKRAAGILKMKHDMQALARAQFAEANKQHIALKAKLDHSEAQTRMLEESAKEKDSQVKAAVRKAEELQRQVEALQKAQADSSAEASRREQLLREETSALREEAESRLDELEAMARERDSANNGRDVSQDALARMAIRNTQMKESVADLEGKVKELEGFCTEALDELDAEKAKNAKLLAASGK
eukprot:g16880.t1